ncbi:hypothetical protein FACS1894208_04720 [Clostridia bacterium]|nr:hypothetical protein FACS1894208_04720 [Clostridia bacterium]
MGKRYKVEVSRNANKKLWEHVDFLTNVSETAAERLSIKLYADIVSLAYMPHRYPLYRKKYRRMISAKHYIIIYTIVGDTVRVSDIQDGRGYSNGCD